MRNEISCTRTCVWSLILLSKPVAGITKQIDIKYAYYAESYYPPPQRRNEKKSELIKIVEN